MPDFAPLTYSVDLALCIDATGTMSPIIELVKARALRLSDDIGRMLVGRRKPTPDLRARVIVYRDLHEDGGAALVTSPFYSLPEQQTQFAGFLRDLRAHGGGDEPESGLEALATAMRSPWTQGGDRRRHVIVVWTDASAHQLEDAIRRRSLGYPKDLPRSWAELSMLWEGMNRSAKRLLFYAPDVAPWTDIQNEWENTVHIISRAGLGLSEFEYEDVLETIIHSI